MAFEKDPNEIGCLWAKDSAKGPYLTGEINGVAVVCFAVKSSNPKSPAWRVLKSKPRDGQSRSTERLDSRESERPSRMDDTDDFRF